MHPYHTGIHLIMSVKSAFSHQCIAHRRIHALYTCLKLFTRSGKYCTTTDKNIRLFGLCDHMYCLLDIRIIKGAFLRLRHYRFLSLVFYFICSHILGDIHKYRVMPVMVRSSGTLVWVGALR